VVIEKSLQDKAFSRDGRSSRRIIVVAGRGCCQSRMDGASGLKIEHGIARRTRWTRDAVNICCRGIVRKLMQSRTGVHEETRAMDGAREKARMRQHPFGGGGEPLEELRPYFWSECMA